MATIRALDHREEMASTLTRQEGVKITPDLQEGIVMIQGQSHSLRHGQASPITHNRLQCRAQVERAMRSVPIGQIKSNNLILFNALGIDHNHRPSPRIDIEKSIEIKYVHIPSSRKSPYLGSIRLPWITLYFDRRDLGIKDVFIIVGLYEERAQRDTVDEYRPSGTVEFTCSAISLHHFWWLFDTTRDCVLVLVGYVSATPQYIVADLFHPDHSLGMQQITINISRFKPLKDQGIRNSVSRFLFDAAGRSGFGALVASVPHSVLTQGAAPILFVVMAVANICNSGQGHYPQVKDPTGHSSEDHAIIMLNIKNNNFKNVRQSLAMPSPHLRNVGLCLFHPASPCTEVGNSELDAEQLSMRNDIVNSEAATAIRERSVRSLDNFVALLQDHAQRLKPHHIGTNAPGIIHRSYHCGYPTIYMYHTFDEGGADKAVFKAAVFALSAPSAALNQGGNPIPMVIIERLDGCHSRQLHAAEALFVTKHNFEDYLFIARSRSKNLTQPSTVPYPHLYLFYFVLPHSAKTSRPDLMQLSDNAQDFFLQIVGTIAGAIVPDEYGDYVVHPQCHGVEESAVVGINVRGSVVFHRSDKAGFQVGAAALVIPTPPNEWVQGEDRRRLVVMGKTDICHLGQLHASEVFFTIKDQYEGCLFTVTNIPFPKVVGAVAAAAMRGSSVAVVDGFVAHLLCYSQRDHKRHIIINRPGVMVPGYEGSVISICQPYNKAGGSKSVGLTSSTLSNVSALDGDVIPALSIDMADMCRLAPIHDTLEVVYATGHRYENRLVTAVGYSSLSMPPTRLHIGTVRLNQDEQPDDFTVYRSDRYQLFEIQRNADNSVGFIFTDYIQTAKTRGLVTSRVQCSILGGPNTCYLGQLHGVDVPNVYRRAGSLSAMKHDAADKETIMQDDGYCVKVEHIGPIMHGFCWKITIQTFVLQTFPQTVEGRKSLFSSVDIIGDGLGRSRKYGCSSLKPVRFTRQRCELGLGRRTEAGFRIMDPDTKPPQPHAPPLEGMPAGIVNLHFWTFEVAGRL
ncbi:hypothetical protein BU17DRAFT_83035 [Hysterangium stoloniferum]|nr:hypothetical protein BU17DRAFT_83035 [Hysterangium stoloniferum]